jgi:hypothetical protein
MGMTTYDKGFAVGLLIGQREGLLIWLDHRFGEVSQEVRDRIDTFSQDQIDELVHRIRDANSLAELGFDDCTPTLSVTKGDS